ncbi:MAG: hypothetical protein KVP17_004044 [Porospora cf. gigantea B]|uniref:uncharacterized protein n=1 Tax=Porospora cf. gigantea B TaxID=2853592 RepID=UPI003571CAC8|nr:MAG: hypothetical protein KVP17_004044 [Porospora cf. gigantea B]
MQACCGYEVKQEAELEAVLLEETDSLGAGSTSAAATHVKPGDTQPTDNLPVTDSMESPLALPRLDPTDCDTGISLAPAQKTKTSRAKKKSSG